MKKRIFTLTLAAAMALSLAGCGGKKPGLEEVEAAISVGNITIEDALEKGWVTEQWVEEYMDKLSVPSSNKMEAGHVGDFTTTTLSGEEFSNNQIGKVALFAFIDTEDSEAESFYKSLLESYEGVKENGADIVVCLKNETNTEMFKDAPFTVLLYNDSVKSATENHKEMIEDNGNTASWYVNGSFYSAWYNDVTAEKLVESAASFVSLQQELENAGNSDKGGMAAMG